MQFCFLDNGDMRDLQQSETAENFKHEHKMTLNIILQC